MTEVIEIGLDEAGVGCVFGDLCAAAVWLPEITPALSGLTDSKKLTAKQRESYASIIKADNKYGIGLVSSQEINEIGLGKARRIVFHRAIDDFIRRTQRQPTQMIVDGTLFEEYNSLAYKCVPKADMLYPSVSAASVIAKTLHDSRIQEWSTLNPQQAEQYDIAKNKGYITKRHKDGLRRFGFTEHHRNYTIKL